MADETTPASLNDAEIAVIAHLAGIAAEARSDVTFEPDSPILLMDAWSNVRRLLATVAAYREIVAAVANGVEMAKWWNPERLWVCPFCQAYVSSANEHISHTSTCPVTRARALLGTPAPGTTVGEDEEA